MRDCLYHSLCLFFINYILILVQISLLWPLQFSYFNSHLFTTNLRHLMFGHPSLLLWSLLLDAVNMLFFFVPLVLLESYIDCLLLLSTSKTTQPLDVIFLMSGVMLMLSQMNDIGTICTFLRWFFSFFHGFTL